MGQFSVYQHLQNILSTDDLFDCMDWCQVKL